jgi:hypothetical protein
VGAADAGVIGEGDAVLSPLIRQPVRFFDGLDGEHGVVTGPDRAAERLAHDLRRLISWPPPGPVVGGLATGDDE